MESNHLKLLKDLSLQDRPRAGGKGASLGELISLGLNVPPGFVILASAFNNFCRSSILGQDIKSLMSQVKASDMNSIDQASRIIKSSIAGIKIPAEIESEILAAYEKFGTSPVAVRSSATAEDSESASWAGELSTFLNIDREHLVESVRKCWASLFTQRAIFYRLEKSLSNEEISVAVVVQKMIPAEVSGVVFTVHPVTKDKNQMIIEAGWGLGEAIVSGQITPDNYVVDKAQGSILEKTVARQTEMIKADKVGIAKITVSEADQEKVKLDEEKILELARICQKIEKHFGSPCDIEWAMAGGQVYILQSRPITTL